MDNLTHALTGVVLARAGLSRRFGKGTTLLLALASNLPDVDVVLLLDGPFAAACRRTFTHSVVGVPLLALALAVLVKRWVPQASLAARFGLALLGAGVHVLMDLLNSYGVELAHPLSSARWELAWVFIIDLAIWAILLAPLVLQRTPAIRIGVERLNQAALLVLALYVGTCAGCHARAREIVDGIAHADGREPSFVHVFPEPFGPHRFRGVARWGDAYGQWLVHVVDGRVEPLGGPTTDADLPEVRAVRERPDARRVEAFFKAPVWTIDRERGVARVTDLRFASAVLRRRGAAFAYEFPLGKASTQE